MRLAFLGTPEFALPALKALIDKKFEVVAVYSQPPKPQGRGHKVQKSVIHSFAETQNIPVYTPKSLRDKDEQKFFQNLNLDLAIVAAYGLILPKEILNAPLLGCLNIHGSLLPRWRGAAPIQRAIEMMDTETGITIMQMDEGLDTGNMLLKEATPILRKTAQDLQIELSQMGADLLIETICHIQKIKAIPQPQDGVTYAKKLQKEEGFIDWQETAEKIEAKIRAFTPWPGCSFLFQEERVKILKAHWVPFAHNKKPGTLLDDKLLIACKENALCIELLQRPGKKALNATEFLCAINLHPGDTFEGTNAPL